MRLYSGRLLLVLVVILSYFLQIYFFELGWFALKPYLITSALCAPILFIRPIHFNLFDFNLLIFFLAYNLSSLWSNLTVDTFRFFLINMVTYYCFIVAKQILCNAQHHISKTLPVVILIFLVASAFHYGVDVLTNFSSGMKEGYGMVYDRGMPRFSGVINNPNYYIVFCLPIIAFLVLATSLQPRVRTVLLVCALSSVVLTFSISGIAATLVTITVAATQGGRNLLLQYTWLAITLTITLVCVYLLVLNFYEVGWLDSIIQKRLDQLQHGSSRFNVWAILLSEIDGAKWLYGHGLGESTSYSSNNLNFYNIHNTYLELLYDGGVALLVIFAVIILHSLAIARKFYRDKQTIGFVYASLIGTYLCMFGLSLLHTEILILQYAMLSAAVTDKSSAGRIPLSSAASRYTYLRLGARPLASGSLDAST